MVVVAWRRVVWWQSCGGSRVVAVVFRGVVWGWWCWSKAVVVGDSDVYALVALIPLPFGV